MGLHVRIHHSSRLSSSCIKFCLCSFFSHICGDHLRLRSLKCDCRFNIRCGQLRRRWWWLHLLCLQNLLPPRRLDIPTVLGSEQLSDRNVALGVWVDWFRAIVRQKHPRATSELLE